MHYAAILRGQGHKKVAVILEHAVDGLYLDLTLCYYALCTKPVWFW